MTAVREDVVCCEAVDETMVVGMVVGVPLMLVVMREVKVVKGPLLVVLVEVVVDDEVDSEVEVGVSVEEVGSGVVVVVVVVVTKELVGGSEVVVGVVVEVEVDEEDEEEVGVSVVEGEVVVSDALELGLDDEV